MSASVLSIRRSRLFSSSCYLAIEFLHLLVRCCPVLSLSTPSCLPLSRVGRATLVLSFRTYTS